MRPTQIKLKPEIQLPNIKLEQLLQYPELQRRVNNQHFQLSGIHNLIVQLRKQTIQELKEQFINNNNSVNLHQFMWLISNSIMTKGGVVKKTIQEQYYQYEIQYEIVRVFQEIDIDNSNSISWEEYIQYITSSSLMEINQNSEKQLYALTSQQKSVKQLTYSHRQKSIFRKFPIRKIVQIPKLQMIAVIEKKSDILTFLSMNGNILNKNFQLNGVDHNKVLSIDYCEQDRMFGVLMNSHNVIFVEDGQVQKVYGENKFLGDQIEIKYLKLHKMWLLLSLDNSIQIFSPDKGRKNQDESKRTMIRFKPHVDQLVGIKQLLNPLSIITASWNGSIKIWSLTLNQLLIQLNPCKQQDFSQCKSIKGFQVYNNQLTSYMICWLFSPQISVWLPSSSLTKPYFGKLKGHLGIVQQAKFLRNFPVVISIDNANSIRVWDITKMQCIQTWKTKASINLKIQVLCSIPYVLFYYKLIQYYKSTKQTNFNEFKTQKIQSLPINHQRQLSRPKKQGSNIKKQVRIIQKPSEIIKYEQQGSKKSQSDKKSVLQLQKSKSINTNTNTIINTEQDIQLIPYQTKTGQKLSIVISVLYDDYIDCLAILTSQCLSLVAVNTGKLLNKLHTKNRNESFVAMCLKYNRRIFLANNMGQINFIKTEDCSSLYKLYPFQDLLCDNMFFFDKQKETPQVQPKIFSDISSIQKSKIQKANKQAKIFAKNNNMYQIFAIDYNPFNEVLLLIAFSQQNSIIITYDNFSSFQPSKKKQVIFDQTNLCCFVESNKYNLFFIASNQPEIITIWDYHNFVILRTLQMPNRIINLSVQNIKYNFLIITQSLGVRIFKVLPIDARNNTRGSEVNLVTNQLFIKSNKTILRAEIIYAQSKVNKNKIKSKVDFHDLEQSNSKKQVHQNDNLYQYDEKIELYILFNSMINIIDMQQIMKELPVNIEPLHCSKANITKEVKKITINPCTCPASNREVKVAQINKEVIDGSRKGTIILGKTNDLIYFENDLGVLYFYKVIQQKTNARISIPKCQVIEWQICYNLVKKVINRLKKAEEVSKQIYALKRRQKQDEIKMQYLRCSFILNKYFNIQDMNEIREYFQQVQKMKKKKKMTEKEYKPSILKLQNNQNMTEKKQQKQMVQFDQKLQQRSKLRSQTNKKMKQIQKKYNKVFNYIKNRQQSSQQETKQQKTMTKNRSASVGKLNSYQNKKNSSSSVFKIRNTVSSVNKMYFQHSKQIKISLNKIGVLNNKIKGLKL